MQNSYRQRRDASSVRGPRTSSSESKRGSYSGGRSNDSRSESRPSSSFSRAPQSGSPRPQRDAGRSSYSPRPSRGGSSSFSRGGASSGRSSFSRGGARPQTGGRRGGRVQKTFDVSQFINKNPVQNTTEEVFIPTHTFGDFGLDARLVDIVTTSGLTSPTPIQDEIIPYILQGKDVIGLANTGTGKTAAFLLPLIHMTLKNEKRSTLILTPTRELAIQIETELKKLAQGLRMYSTICVGGTALRPQLQGLRRKNHFIIGTPGRVLDLMDRGALNPLLLTTIVLDEADRMLDMGFIGDMRKILADVPKGHETLFFSATMSDDIKKLVHDFLHDPISISVKKQDITKSVVQDVVKYAHSNKFEVLTNLLQDPAFKRVLVFGAMKHSVEKLAQQLIAHGVSAESIHGNKSHPQRQRSLKRFKEAHARVLVATDVAARGIHVDNVTHVINYDLPSSYEDYVHRIGRTGRGKEQGMALTFVEA